MKTTHHLPLFLLIFLGFTSHAFSATLNCSFSRSYYSSDNTLKKDGVGYIGYANTFDLEVPSNPTRLYIEFDKGYSAMFTVGIHSKYNSWDSSSEKAVVYTKSGHNGGTKITSRFNEWRDWYEHRLELRDNVKLELELYRNIEASTSLGGNMEKVPAKAYGDISNIQSSTGTGVNPAKMDRESKTLPSWKTLQGHSGKKIIAYAKDESNIVQSPSDLVRLKRRNPPKGLISKVKLQNTVALSQIRNSPKVESLKDLNVFGTYSYLKNILKDGLIPEGTLAYVNASCALK